MKVYSKQRGVRTLKKGIALESYRERYPDARKVKVPSERTLENWNSEGFCKTIDGCRVEPDGVCSHDFPSWLMALGYI